MRSVEVYAHHLKLHILSKKFLFSSLWIGSALYLLVAQISYFFTATKDQSLISDFLHQGFSTKLLATQNWTGFLGACFAHFSLFKYFGLGGVLIPVFMVLYGLRIYRPAIQPHRLLLLSLFLLIWSTTLLGFFTNIGLNTFSMHILSGGLGYEFARILYTSIGWGTLAVLLLLLSGFIIYHLKPSMLGPIFRTSRPISSTQVSFSAPKSPPKTLAQKQHTPESHTLPPEKEETTDETIIHFELETTPSAEPPSSSSISLKKESRSTSSPVSSSQSQVSSYAAYDIPPLTLLEDQKVARAEVSKDELQENKRTIVQTLTNFKISISSIHATIGPTVTLYEIVPAPGVRISKIKSLEDDIALSLAALGIRIIAPIPGKGTIGIEVPNKRREITTLRQALRSKSFAEQSSDLPIVLGKTISNEVLCVDLAKMPHVLMAGATGQGKSVGLNVILSSLLYKKLPHELKFVLVDPKKVELSLFNKIEKHFLAKMPAEEEAIITDTKQVVHTLKALCLEMDNRYELLKAAGCRNIKEYNTKYHASSLSSTEQIEHKFLPYIVLVIDELADLMMTAGKEVEMPIARLAQLARAIGIHLVVATQRPSVNVITGIIKANFPARISFRVTSQIDSRTILDTRGAEQLVGMGDMLFSSSNDLIRLQCPFVSTEEVEAVCGFIYKQESTAPYLLPEVEDEEQEDRMVEVGDWDERLEEAADLIVRYQQGSASLIQRKMKLGFNRAGRLIDQMEVIGIVGPPLGSKPREVLIKDEITLREILSNLKTS